MRAAEIRRENRAEFAVTPIREFVRVQKPGQIFERAFRSHGRGVNDPIIAVNNAVTMRGGARYSAGPRIPYLESLYDRSLRERPSLRAASA